MNDATVVARASAISWCDLGQEIVILRVRDSAYYRLGATARDLWLGLDRPCAVGQLIEAMRATCDGEAGRIRSETISFLRGCLDLGLITAEHVGA